MLSSPDGRLLDRRKGAIVGPPLLFAIRLIRLVMGKGSFHQIFFQHTIVAWGGESCSRVGRICHPHIYCHTEANFEEKQSNSSIISSFRAEKLRKGHCCNFLVPLTKTSNLLLKGKRTGGSWREALGSNVHFDRGGLGEKRLGTCIPPFPKVRWQTMSTKRRGGGSMRGKKV